MRTLGIVVVLIIIPWYLVLVGIAVARFGWSDTVHNVVAHQLLSLCPPVGQWLHERTEPAAMDDRPDSIDAMLRAQLADTMTDPPYVLVCPAHLVATLTQDEAMALARAGITRLPDGYVPGSISVTWAIPPSDAPDTAGVLLVPSELVP